MGREPADTSGQPRSRTASSAWRLTCTNAIRPQRSWPRSVHGMQGVRGSNPLSSTRHNASAGHPRGSDCGTNQLRAPGPCACQPGLDGRGRRSGRRSGPLCEPPASCSGGVPPRRYGDRYGNTLSSLRGSAASPAPMTRGRYRCRASRTRSGRLARTRGRLPALCRRERCRNAHPRAVGVLMHVDDGGVPCLGSKTDEVQDQERTELWEPREP
jgi:hypothetical protein